MNDPAPKNQRLQTSVTPPLATSDPPPSSPQNPNNDPEEIIAPTKPTPTPRILTPDEPVPPPTTPQPATDGMDVGLIATLSVLPDPDKIGQGPSTHTIRETPLTAHPSQPPQSDTPHPPQSPREITNIDKANMLMDMAAQLQSARGPVLNGPDFQHFQTSVGAATAYAEIAHAESMARIDDSLAKLVKHFAYRP